MTAQIPSVEPAELFIGDTWVWQISLNDFPASLWTLKYYLRSREDALEITATASGADHLVTVPKATTALRKAGFYDCTKVVNSATVRTTLERLTFRVRPDPEKTGAGLDAKSSARTHARKVLEAIEAVIENKATMDQLEYTIGNRTLRHMSPEEIVKWRNVYRGEVFQEDNASSVAKGRANASRILYRL